MRIEGTRALITGAGRGLGRALATALLERGAAHVYPAARDLARLQSVYHGEARATPIQLDVTDAASVSQAVLQAGDVEILINNAAVIHYAQVLAGASLMAAREEMEINYWGLLNMSRAFAPGLTRAREAALVNILSVGSLANIPLSGAYCASKAAAFSATQALRAELADSGVLVLAAFPGPIDTEMSTAKDRAGRHSPVLLANNVLDAIEAGRERLYPDPTAAEWGRLYDGDPWALQELFAQFRVRPE